WKGYRDAQCYWVHVADADDPAMHDQPKSHGGRAKFAEFLVLFAPKRDLLEVWHTPFGGRVGAFDIGAGSCVVPVVPMKGDRTLSRCIVIRESGDVDELRVPFSCSVRCDTCLCWCDCSFSSLATGQCAHPFRTAGGCLLTDL